MQDIQLISHGGAQGVTGSCHELMIEHNASLLVDCGMFQGEDANTPENQWIIDFNVDKIKALLLTHCHIDHVGRVPALLAAGYNGPIYCTAATALLLPAVIEDALKVGITRNSRLISEVLKRLGKQLIPVDYAKWQQLTGFESQVKVKFKPAGHIIGSAYIEVAVTAHKQAGQNQTKIVFSGDLGAPYTPLLPAPKAPYGCDWLILESTYGNKEHQGRAMRRKQLKQVVERSLNDGGAILIPAFSIGRTQELLYELEQIIHQAKLSKDHHNGEDRWQKLPIIVDSPLAAHFTKLYRQLKPLWDKEAKRRVDNGRHPLSFSNLITIDDHQQHQKLLARLASTKEPAIIIAASGMCSGGRIVNYLKSLLSKQEIDVLFVGYQGKGTPGRDIQKYGPQGGYVELDGERIDINASIHTINGYSAHADQSDLVNFVKRMRRKPQRIDLVHGEQDAKHDLAKALRRVVEAEINI